MTNPNGEARIISPHSIVFSGIRWHVRAYCEKNKDYRDFVINRIKLIDDEMGKGVDEDIKKATSGKQYDDEWNHYIDLEIVPNPNLKAAQQALIARDYQMQDNKLKIEVRKALAQYTLKQLHVSLQGSNAEKNTYLVLKKT